jgi:dipeptidyl aminopeptidase/acylaminoacyl peptidase
VSRSLNPWSRILTFASLAFAVLLLPAARPAVLAAEDDPLRPPAVETENVPPVPPALVDRLRQYQNVRSAGFRGWSPDGRGILVQTRFGNTSQLHRVYEPGGRREQITFFDEPVNGMFLPKQPDGAVLVSMARGGDENDQFYLLDPANGRAELLTDGESRNLLGAVLYDGSRVVIASNGRNGRDTDLYIVDPRQPGSMKMILETDGEYWTVADWSRDRFTLLINRYISINETYPALLDIVTGEKRMIPPPQPPVEEPMPDADEPPTPDTRYERPRPNNRDAAPGPRLGERGAGCSPPGGERDEPISFGPMAFTPDGKAAWVTCDAPGEFRYLALLDLETFEYHWVTHEIPWDVTAIEVEPETGLAAFTVNEDGASTLYLVAGPMSEQQRRQLDRRVGRTMRPGVPVRIDLPLGIVSSLKFSPDGRQLGFTLARADAPADAYSLRLADGQVVRWTFSEVGGLDTSQFVAPQQIQYESFDDRVIPAYYFRPRGATPERPAAVLVGIHGGPESQYRPWFNSIDQFYLNEMGIAVIRPNVRGSAGYGKTYLKLDNAEKREDSVRDIGALLDWIAEQPELDESRVAVMGGSYGGYMVLASLIHFGDRLRAGVDIVGIASFRTFLENTSPYRRDLRRAEYGDERDPKMQAFFEKIDPVNNAEKIRSALLVAHGRNDPRVPFSEAVQIAEKVRAAGRDVWTVYADNEGHSFARKENRDYLTAVIAMFLAAHLE